jgi:hypothetical protein
MSTKADVLRGKARGLCLSLGSLILESLQFGAAFLAEGTQRIYRVAAQQLLQLGRRPIRCEICLDNHSNDRFRPSDHGRARQNTHSAHQGVDTDERRNLQIVYEGFGVQFRPLVDELFVHLSPSRFIPRKAVGAVLMVLGEPG